MNVICGLLREAPGEAKGMAAVLAALAGYGAHAAEWSDGPIVLGSRRGPSDEGADPPLCVEPGLAVAADARLDDRDALCGALGVPPAARGSLADGDLILRAWRRWGRDCPNHLLGDYAFAVWDAAKRTLFCARDHVGAKPFYYAFPPNGFVFAGAVEGVLAAPGVSGELDEESVAEHLTGIALLTTTRTFFKAVRKLPPGHTLTVDCDSLRQGASSPRSPARPERYWRPEHAPRARAASDDAYAEELLEVCTRAVEDRLRGPGPVGAHLSGGLDSSGIAVLAARALRRRGLPAPLAFSWLPALDGEAPAHAKEYALIDAVCAQEDLQVSHCALSPGDVLAVLRRDGAFPGVHVQMNEEAVQRCAAASGVRVLLSGWGGDEGASFNGRGHLQHLLLSGRWRRLAAECRANPHPFRALAHVALSLAHPRLRNHLHRRLRGGVPRRRRWLIDPAFARRAKPLPVEVFRPIGVRRTQARLLCNGHLSQRIEGWAASGAARRCATSNVSTRPRPRRHPRDCRPMCAFR